MNSNHIAALRRDVREFLEDQPKEIGVVPFSNVISHIKSKRWRTVDDEMFKDWVQSQFPENRQINYKA